MMKKYLGFALITTALAATSMAVTAGVLDLALSDTTAKLDISSADGNNRRKSSVEASFIHNDEQRNGAGLALHVSNKQGLANLMVGIKSYYAALDEEDGSGISIGGKVDYRMLPKLFIRGQAYYAPDVTSFGDIQHYKEAEAKLIYMLLPEAQIFLGFRDIEIDLEELGNHELHEGGFAGISMQF